MQHEISIQAPDRVLERAAESHQQPHCVEAIFLSPLRGIFLITPALILGLTPQAKFLSPLRGFSPGDEMDLSRCLPEGAKRVQGSMGN